MKNNFLILLSVFIAIIIAFVAVTLYKSNKRTNEPSTTKIRVTPTTSLYVEEGCEGLVEDIRAMLVKANYCITDSDCTSKIAVGYPFSCSTLVNNDSDISGIESAYLKFVERCNPPMYDCDRAPTKEEIKCEEGVCVDTRYNNLP